MQSNSSVLVEGGEDLENGHQYALKKSVLGDVPEYLRMCRQSQVPSGYGRRGGGTWSVNQVTDIILDE